MGFTAATISVPSLPASADLLTYLTAPASSKSQEEAQAQSRALAFAILHGVSNADIEAGFFGGESVGIKPLTTEEKQSLQNAKSSFIPKMIDPDGMHKTNCDYHFLYPVARSRYNVYHETKCRRVADTNPERETSLMGSTRAPILRPTVAEFADLTAFLETNAHWLQEYGMVRVILPEQQALPIPVGITDNIGFKSETQLKVLAENQDQFIYSNLRRGFYLALGRYLERSGIAGSRKLTKFPFVEGRPLDLYQFFRIVEQRQGPDVILKRKEWVQVCKELGLQKGQYTSVSLRAIYSKFLEPFRAWLTSHVELSRFIVLPLSVTEGEVPKDWKELEYGIICYKPTLSKGTTNATGNDSTQTANTINTSQSGHSPVQSPNVIKSPSPETNDLKYGKKSIFINAFAQDNIQPPFTLRGFKNKTLTVDSRTLDETEKLYTSLPECYETEKSVDSPVLLRLLPNDVDSSLNPALNIMYMAFQKGTVTKYIHDPIDELIFPKLEAGSSFATHKIEPNDNDYRIIMLFDGAPRTYTTSNGVWSDQKQGELLILSPETQVECWCHNYSAVLSVSIMPWFDWFKRFRKALMVEISNGSESIAFERSKICGERTVFEAALDAKHLEERDRHEIVLTLEILQQRDTMLINQLKKLNKSHTLKTVKQTVTCALTGRKLYMLYLTVKKKPMSVSAYLKHASDPEYIDEAITIHSKYHIDEVSSFYSQLIEHVKNASSVAIVTSEWKSKVEHAISTKKLITLSEIDGLLQECPKVSECIEIACTLQEMKSNMLSFIVPSNHAVDPRNSVFVNAIECQDDHGIVERIYQQHERDIAEVDISLDHIVEQIRSNVPVENIVSKFSTSGKLGAVMLFVRRLPLLEKWVQNVRTALENPDANTRSQLLNVLRQEMEGLAIQRSSEPGLQIEKVLEQEKSNLLDRLAFLYTTEFRDVEKIRRLHMDWPAGDEHVQRTINEVYAAIPLIERFDDPLLLRRPRLSQMQHLNYPLVRQYINDMNAWLESAKNLDWESISLQVNAMIWSHPLPAQSKVISVEQIKQAYSKLFTLNIVPDDIESVDMMFRNTLASIDTCMPNVCQKYGFY